MAVNELQETPPGKPWERNWIRFWQPAPFDLDDYERWAAAQMRRRFHGVSGQIRGHASSMIILDDPRHIDPLLRTTPKGTTR